MVKKSKKGNSSEKGKNKKDCKKSFFKIFFLIAAIYDLILGFTFFFFYEPIMKYFNILIPTYPMYLQLLALFVFVLGLGFYLIYKNLNNLDLAKICALFKLSYAGLVSYFYFVDLANVVFFWFAICDFIFLAITIWFIVYTKKQNKN